MINRPVLKILALLPMGLASAVSAHGVHVQEVKQTATGIMGEFVHLMVGHGYWVLLLVIGLVSVAVRAGVLGRHLENKRGDRPRIHDQHHKH